MYCSIYPTLTLIDLWGLDSDVEANKYLIEEWSQRKQLSIEDMVRNSAIDGIAQRVISLQEGSQSYLQVYGGGELWDIVWPPSRHRRNWCAHVYGIRYFGSAGHAGFFEAVAKSYRESVPRLKRLLAELDRVLDNEHAWTLPLPPSQWYPSPRPSPAPLHTPSRSTSGDEPAEPWTGEWPEMEKTDIFSRIYAKTAQSRRAFWESSFNQRCGAKIRTARCCFWQKPWVWHYALRLHAYIGECTTEFDPDHVDSQGRRNYQYGEDINNVPGGWEAEG